MTFLSSTEAKHHVRSRKVRSTHTSGTSLAQLVDPTGKAGGYPAAPMAQPIAPNPLRRGLVEDRTADACAVVIFGASGDLTRRKLMPALYNLACGRSLPGGFAVVGVARSPKTDESFRAEMRAALSTFSRRRPVEGGAGGVGGTWADFERGISYVRGAASEASTYEAL